MMTACAFILLFLGILFFGGAGVVVGEGLETSGQRPTLWLLSILALVLTVISQIVLYYAWVP
jgi:hypothetical protein